MTAHTLFQEMAILHVNQQARYSTIFRLKFGIFSVKELIFLQIILQKFVYFFPAKNES